MKLRLTGPGVSFEPEQGSHPSRNRTHLGLKAHSWATNRGESLGVFVVIHDVGETQTRGGLARQFIAIKGGFGRH